MAECDMAQLKLTHALKDPEDASQTKQAWPQHHEANHQDSFLGADFFRNVRHVHNSALNSRELGKKP